MSDHFSGPMVMGDPSVDITDLNAFPSPERPGVHLAVLTDLNHRLSIFLNWTIGLGGGRAEHVITLQQAGDTPWRRA